MDAKHEYDRFGPWILEIGDKDSAPPLFEPFLDKKESPQFCIKIPRDIERRKANPGMNLYDYVISVFECRLQILKRQDDGVNVQELNCSDIKCIDVQEELLSGSVCIYTSKKSVNIPFNTVSTDIVIKMVTLIRQKYAHRANFKEIDQLSFQPEDTMSHGFIGFLSKELAKDNAITVLAAQPEVSVASPQASMIQRLRQAVTGKKLLETLVLSNGKELIIYNCSQHFRYRRQVIYSFNKLFVPIEHISGFTIDTDDSSIEVERLTLSVSKYIFPIFFMQNNPSLMPFIGALTASTGIELQKGRNYDV